MPWVFTYNDWSAGTEYDWMVQAAVTSAIEVRPAASCACTWHVVRSSLRAVPARCTLRVRRLRKQCSALACLQVGRVKPHCMFTGSTESAMYRWLAGKGITLILVRCPCGCRAYAWTCGKLSLLRLCKHCPGAWAAPWRSHSHYG